MENALFALPIQSGKTDAARSFLNELESQRKGQYAESERRLGISKEVWAIQQTSMGDLFVVFFQSNDIPEPSVSSLTHKTPLISGSKAKWKS
jgi:hypothetical protein